MSNLKTDEIWTAAPVGTAVPVWEDNSVFTEHIDHQLLLKDYGPKKLFVMKLVHELFPHLKISELFKLELPIVLCRFSVPSIKEENPNLNIKNLIDQFKQLNAETEIKRINY